MGIKRMVVRAILEGDIKLIELLLSRALGKAPDEVIHPDSNHAMLDDILGKRDIDCAF